MQIRLLRSAMEIVLLASFALTVSGCYRNSIKEPKPKEREFETGKYAANDEENAPAVGSIYSEAQSGLLQDTRALRVGDIVTIRISEHADARGGASTSLSRESNREAGVEEFMGLVKHLQASNPAIDPSTLYSLVSDYQFKGNGQTSRAGSLEGRIGVRVRNEMPNGDLYVEGTKIVMINHEEYHLYISGVIRTADILPDNSIDSSLISDSRVEFTGSGDIEEQTQQGWLSWLLNKVNPF
jgi:flagellar L-ring protein FlgH